MEAMAHLLHIDSSVLGDYSVSRKLSAHTAARWEATHPGGTVSYRDLALTPVPHLTAATGAARAVPAELRTPAQHESFALTTELVNEIQAADTVLLGLGLYNFGPPSTVKAWVDHIVALGVSVDPDSQAGLLTGKEFIVLEARGGGYGPGTPREGWDHAQAWLPHAVSLTGLTPQFITAELTNAKTVPAMAEFIPLADASYAEALTQIDQLWSTQP
jgi:FMN-dependent NADH-azoreductase